MEKERWIEKYDKLMEMDAAAAGNMEKSTDAMSLIRHHTLGF